LNYETLRQEVYYQEKLEKQRFMYDRKQNYLDYILHTYVKNITYEEKESDKNLINIYKEILIWIESNAHILTRGKKMFNNNEINYREAIETMLAAEQNLEY